MTNPYDAIVAGLPSAEAQEREREVGSSQVLVRQQAGTGGLVGTLSRKAPEPDWTEITRGLPSTQELLADPVRAARVADDVEGLSAFERLFGGMTEIAWETAQSWKRGRANERIAQIGYRQSVGAATPDELAEAERLEELLAGLAPVRQGFFPGIPAAVAESLPLMLGSAAEAGRETSVGAAAGVAAGAAGGAAVGGVGAVPGAAGGLLAGAGIGFRTGTTIAMGKREKGLAYREYMQLPGVTHETAAFASTIVGAANGALEVLPLDLVLQVPGLKAFFRGAGTRDAFRRALRSTTGRAAVARAAARLAGGMTLEGLTEAAQELSTILGGELIDEQPGVAVDWDRVLEAGIKGAQAGAGMGAPGVAAGLQADLAEAARVRERAGFFTELGKVAAESKTIRDLPEEAQAHVEAIQARTGGPVEAVSAPAEALQRLFQANEITLEQVARRMPAVARQLEEAAGNPGVEIAIPTAEFAVNVAPLKGYEQLVMDLRVGDELTLREAEKVEAEAKELAAAEAKREGKAAEVPALPHERVVADVAAKLEAAGQDADVARTNAALWGAFARVMAGRTGAKDAWAFYEALGLQVEHEDVAAIPTGDPDLRVAAQTIRIRPGKLRPLPPPGPSLSERLDLSKPSPLGAVDPALLEEAERAALAAGALVPEDQLVYIRVAQPPAKDGAQVRGYATFPESRAWFNVTLTGSANLSTFLHESGHVFLEVLRGYGAVNEDIGADLKAVHDWLGVPLTGEFSEEQLERFARGFEAYLREGRAPSSALADVFATCKAWLLHVYRTLRGLDVQLTDEVRGVMDRLVATEAEIAEARQAAGLLPVESAELAGMTEAEYSAYRERFEKGARAAQAEVEQRSLAALERTLGAERQAVRAEVEQLAREQEVFNLREFLRTGKRLDGAAVPEEIAGAKLDRASLDGYADARELRRLQFFTAGEGTTGLDPDTLAPYFGFRDGHELVRALVGTPRREAWIRAEVAARMAERYPDSKLSDLSRQAVAAVQEQDGIVRALMDELGAVGRKVGAGPAKSALEVLRRGAKQRVAGMVELELRPDKYRRAEAAAAKEFLEHLAGKRFAEAHDAKRRQLWNHFMAAETSKAKAEVERIRTYLHGFEDIGKRRRIGKAGQRYVDALDALLEGIQLRRESVRAIGKRHSLAKHVAEMEAEGDVVAPQLKELSELKSYRTMTLEELRGVEAAAANLEAMARLKGKLLLSKEKRDLARTAAELAEHVRANLGTKAAPTPGDLGKLDKAREWLRSADADMKKVEFICRILDGGQTAGLAHSLIFQPLRDAQNARYQLQEQVHGALMKPFQELSLERRRRYAQRVGFLYSRKAGKMVELTRRNVLSVALNLGNEGNRRRLLEGYGWTEAEVLARLDQLLDDGDLAIVEHIWKAVDGLWPAMKELSERHVGLPPPRVEATPFTLPGGRALSGGYYPIVKSRRLSYLGQQIAEKENALWEANFFAPVVEHGFTKSRGKDMSPLELSLDVVPAHLDKVIHYLTHYEAIRGVDRLIQQGAVKDAVTQGLGGEYYNTLRPWLENIAADGSLHEPLIWYERVLRNLRFGSSVVLLFGKIPTGLKQFLGLFTSAKELKRKHLVSGTRKFLREGWGEVLRESPEFKYMDKQLDRDARELFSALEASFTELGGLKRQVTQFAAMPIMLCQKTVNAITWYAAREQAMAEGHASPVAYADAVVSMTQTGGGAKDLAAVQRGGELRKMFTVMFSYRSVLYNQLTEQGSAKGATQRLAHFWWLVMVPVLVEQLLMNGVDDDEDLEDVVKRVGLEFALLPASTVPFAGDLPRAALEERVPRVAPWLDTTYRAAVAAGKAAAGDATKWDARAIVDFVGMATQMPTAALWNYGAYTDALLSGELEEPVQDLLFRNPSKWE